MEWGIWMPVGLGAAFAALALGFSLRAAQRRLLIDNIPTCKTTGVFIGLVELKGVAVREPALESYLAGERCAYYRYAVRERWSRTRTVRDSDGRESTETETGWQTIAQGSSDSEPFELADDRGAIRILPAEADVEAKQVYRLECTPDDPRYWEKAPRTEIADTEHRREFVESAIPLEAPIYVIGHARQRTDKVAAEIAHKKGGEAFVISMRGEETVSSGLRTQFWLLGAVALALLAGGMYWQDILRSRPFEPSRYAPPAAAALAAWAVGWAWMAYNSLVALRQRVAQAWANIDVELKRRADLLPGLAGVVGALRDHERRVQTELAALRTQATATAPGQPGPDPSGVQASLRVVAEAYPELKANAGFLKLQTELVVTEDRIALARGYFNDIAAFYNARIQMFPEGVIASLGAMHPRALMSWNSDSES